jgi:hypothetical protein
VAREGGRCSRSRSPTDLTIRRLRSLNAGRALSPTRESFSLAIMNKHFRSIILVAAMCGALYAPSHAASQPAVNVRDTAAGIVARIQLADYEGDRAALQRLFDELTPLRTASEDKHLTSRIRYWQGFALWRRAINGFNDSAPPAELERDLQLAAVEFEEALKIDGTFVDAKLGIASALGNIAAMYARTDRARVDALLPRIIQLTKESQASAPDNPRYFWIRGPQLWWIPVEQGGGQAAAMANYEKGLEVARKQKGLKADPLEPSWGEPELLMSLAWSQLNQPTPNVAAADEHATRALALVPHWRYVRDILMPQVQAAKAKK